ncbi:Hsp20 family protein [Magnetospira sp. QH-2]|uniref:Hsp20 family protein n=1 Tax=Magnetospira sp. (strain QH-2) TaxID=1288970 RepID=UPI0003E813AF|nr:Hsp20 family protein [Magnetospira sp. QH-2]CCQ74065.1 Small heat shock protein hspD [Magnetospira sp. QH-2]
MTRYDFSPLFRSTVGFDRMQRMMDSALRLDESNAAYPPYNIEKLGEDDYRITMAVAGFAESDIDVVVENDTLTVSGQIESEGDEATYLHRGIATRAFQRRFQLADHIKVSGGSMVDGLLHIDLVHEVPEAMKPRKIEIGAGSAPKIEKKAA